MDLKEISINTRNGVDLTQDRDFWKALMNVVLNLWIPQVIELVIKLELELCIRPGIEERSVIGEYTVR